MSEIVAEFKTPEGIQEVRATADGNYNEDTSQLLVKLDSSLRPLTGQSKTIQADWLPQSETIKVSISSSEAFDAVKEIFAVGFPGFEKRFSTTAAELRRRQGVLFS